MKTQIYQKLDTTLQPEMLEVIDESHLHAGHAGWKEGGNTHFRIKIQSSRLGGLSRVKQHQQIYTILDEELKAGLHALAIEINSG